MPNINTALKSLWSKTAKTEPSYVLILIFWLLIFFVFSQRIFNVKSQYYILLATILILLLMIFMTGSIFSSDPKLLDNNFLSSINNIFDNPSSRNFISVISLILYIMLIYELANYDNNDPQQVLDKMMFGKNNYISNRTSGLLVIFGFGTFVAYTIMKTTRQ